MPPVKIGLGLLRILRVRPSGRIPFIPVTFSDRDETWILGQPLLNPRYLGRQIDQRPSLAPKMLLSEQVSKISKQPPILPRGLVVPG